MKLPRGPVTNALAIAIFLAFLPVQLGGLTNQAAISAGFIPARIHALAAQNMTLDVDWLPVWLTPLSSTFVHEGWLHIAFNLMMLLFCGRFVEHLFGKTNVLILYVVGAYAASAAQWAIAPASMSPVIGASGAISALIGCYALMFSQNEVKALGPIPAHFVRIIWLGLAWTALQVMIAVAGASDSFFGAIAVAAHIGGFIAGLLLARPLLMRRFRRPPD